VALDPYEVLGVPRDADDEAIRRAWREAVRRHPPEVDPEGFRRAREAYETLRDASARTALRLRGRPRLPDVEPALARLRSEALPLDGESIRRQLLAVLLESDGLLGRPPSADFRPLPESLPAPFPRR